MTPAPRSTARLAMASLVVAATLASCFSERQAPTAPANAASECRLDISGPGIGATEALVAIENYRFVPATIRVPRGTTVRWVNCEPFTAGHTSTSNTGAWASGELMPKDTYARTFNELGTFKYHCAPHPFMEATVIVE